jgi:hypothetical protein
MDQGEKPIAEEAGGHPEAPPAETTPELRSWQLVELYGGDCMYQLFAQTGKTNCFSAYSEKVYLASPPRSQRKKRR